MKYLLFVIIFALVSCSPSKRAENLVDKAMKIDAAAAVKRIGPPKIIETRIVRDTIKVKEFERIREEIIRRADSVKIIGPIGDNCDELRRKLTDANEFIDGLQSLLDDLPVVTDTIYVKDSLSSWLCEYNTKVLEKDIDRQKSKRIRDLELFLILFVVMILTFAYLIFKKK